MVRTKQTARKKKSTGATAQKMQLSKRGLRKPAQTRPVMKAKQIRNNFASNRKTTWKSDSRIQNGGQWRGTNTHGQGSWGLSYESSQEDIQTSVSFSSFFAPSNSLSGQTRVVELGLLIRKHWVGGLIGKKGKTIWMLRDKSNGANIDFGDEDILIDRSKDSKWEQSP